MVVKLNGKQMLETHERGNWCQILWQEKKGTRIKYYYRNVRVPWILWAMFS